MWSSKDAQKFAAVGLAFEVLLVIVYGICFTYDKGMGDGDVALYYGMFQDVHVMIFVGFGFLMTFLSQNGFGSVGLNFMISAYVIQWAIVCNSLIHALWHHDSLTGIPIKMSSLVTADFAAAVVLISFGAVVGRVSPLQLLAMAVMEIVFFAVNENIGITLGAVDAGGSMIVHAFGAYFGLAASLGMSRGKKTEYTDHPLNVSTKTSDMFAMVGTLFLWIFWPSFCGVLTEGMQRYRVVVNTVLALAASCGGSFSFTLLFRPERKFSMVDIQNATLAGGVAIGTCCNLNIGPFGALIVGLVASFVSAGGYNVVQPRLEASLGLFDTCGVNNLHGMPGVLGGLAGVVAALMATDSTYDNAAGLYEIYELRATEAAAKQALRQFGCLAVTLVVALVSGYLVGNVINLPFFLPVTKGQEYQDTYYWEVEGAEHPSPEKPEKTAPAPGEETV